MSPGPFASADDLRVASTPQRTALSHGSAQRGKRRYTRPMESPTSVQQPSRMAQWRSAATELARVGQAEPNNAGAQLQQNVDRHDWKLCFTGGWQSSAGRRLDSR